jgi:hypothetical protein
MDGPTKEILSDDTQKLILENLLGFKITLARKFDGLPVYYGPGRKEIVRLIEDGAPFVRITDGSVKEGNFSDIRKKGKGLLYIIQDSPKSERYGEHGEYGKCLYTLIVSDQESMYATTSPFKKHRSSKKKSTRRKKRSTRKTSTRRV